jgi:hypothetical protein
MGDTQRTYAAGGSWAAIWSQPHSSSATEAGGGPPLARGSAHELPLTQVRWCGG